MSVADIIHKPLDNGANRSEKLTRIGNGGVDFKVFDDIKKTRTPRRAEERFNNLTASSDSIYRNHHYYHKNCFSSVDDLNSAERKFVRKENNMSKEFFNSLDSKLRNLDAAPPARQKRSPPSKTDNRPMFVTTVKTGIFLEPPPELAAILGLQSYSSSLNGSSGSTGSIHQSNGEEVIMYSFSSQPRVVNQRCQRTRAPPPTANRNKTVAKNHNNNVNGNNNGSNVKARQKRDLNGSPPKKQ